MAEITASKGTTANKQPMDNCCFDIMTQVEKKADFLYHVADTDIYRMLGLQIGRNWHIFGMP